MNDVMDHTPNAKIVGPMYSQEAPESDYTQALAAFLALGNSISDIHASSLHTYNGPQFDTVTEQIDDHYNNYMIPNGMGSKPVWITEIGWHECGPGNLEDIEPRIQAVEADSRVEHYFLFAPTWSGDDGGCEYHTLFDEGLLGEDWKQLAEFGKIVRRN